ncbi:hypothetical protein MMC31_006827, partial [Peltigera leucophlebia]|nr:hypothetical protein [Peltigera leucophlebia]
MTADLIVRMFIYFILVILENLFGVYLDIIGEVERMVLYETFLDCIMKNILAVIGLIIFIIYLCSRKLPPEIDCISNPELLTYKKAALTSTVEKIKGAEIENTVIKKTSPFTNNDNTKNWTRHPKPMHKHLAMDKKPRNHCIERLKAEHRDDNEKSLSDNKRALALARATERSITSNQQPKLSHKARISRLSDMGINSIRRSHGYPEMAFQGIQSPKLDETVYGKEALSNYGELDHSVAASSDAHADEVEERGHRATAMNEPNEEGVPAGEPTSPTTFHPTQVIAGKTEGPAMESNPEEFSEILDERELEDMLTLGGHFQNNLDAAAVPDIYGSEVNSAWFELQAHYQVPSMVLATSLSDSRDDESRDDEPRDEPIQEARSEPANAGIYLTPAQEEEYNRASAEANNTRNPFDSDDEAKDEDEDEACKNIFHAGDKEVQNGAQQDSIGPAFLPQPASTLVVDLSPPAMAAARTAPIAPEQTAIHLSPEQSEEYNQVSSAAFNARNPFDSDDEDDEPLPSTVGSAAEKISIESKSTAPQNPPMAVYAPKTALAPMPAPAAAAAPVNLKMVFLETDALPQNPTAPSTAPTHIWHNPEPAPTIAVAASLPPYNLSFNHNGTRLTTYSPGGFPSMIWEHCNPTPMDWDTATSIHLSNSLGRIITVGGFDVEAGTLWEFREVRGAARLKGRRGQQQVLLDRRAGPGKKKSLATA